MTPKDLLNIGLVCTEWKHLSEDPFIWKNLFMRNSKFKFRALTTQQKTTSRNWKQIFVKKAKEEHQLRRQSSMQKANVEEFSELVLKKTIKTTEKLFNFHCETNSFSTGPSTSWNNNAQHANYLNSEYHARSIEYAENHSNDSKSGSGVYNGNEVVIGGTYGNAVKLWDMSTGMVLKSFECHTKPVRCVYFDEFILISGSMDKTIKITDMDTELTLNTLTGHTGWVLTLKYDLLHLVSGSSDATIRFWDFHSGACLTTLRGHTEAVRCVESHNGEVISGSADSTLRVWDVNKQTSNKLIGHTEAVTCCQLSKENPFLLWSGSFDGTMALWDLRTSSCVRRYFKTFSNMGSTPAILCLQADAQKVVCGCWDGTVKIVDSRYNTGTPKSVKVHRDAVNCIQLLRDDRLVTSSYDSSIRVWQPFCPMEPSNVTKSRKSFDGSQSSNDSNNLPVNRFTSTSSPPPVSRNITFSYLPNNNNNNHNEKKCIIM